MQIRDGKLKPSVESQLSGTAGSQDNLLVKTKSQDFHGVMDVKADASLPKNSHPQNAAKGKDRKRKHLIGEKEREEKMQESTKLFQETSQQWREHVQEQEGQKHTHWPATQKPTRIVHYLL